MTFAQGLNYTDISNTVYTYGRMQGTCDSHPSFLVGKNFNPDFANGTFENLANRVIVGWTSETSIDESWMIRDCNSLRDMFNLGYRHSIEMELPK